MMKGILSYGSAKFAERLVSFFLLPILTKIVTPAEYAIWSQSIIVAGVLMPVILLKFETSIVKFFPTWNNQNKKQNSVILFMLTLIFILFCLSTGSLFIRSSKKLDEIMKERVTLKRVRLYLTCGRYVIINQISHRRVLSRV